MGIIPGFIKTKRYRKLANGSYQVQSEWTHSDSVEFDDKATLTQKISLINGNIETHAHAMQTLQPSCIEMTPPSGTPHGGYLDFHYSGSSEDFTSRIAELSYGVLTVAQDSNNTNLIDYQANQLRNIVFIEETNDPGKNVPTAYANGSIICVYE